MSIYSKPRSSVERAFKMPGGYLEALHKLLYRYKRISFERIEDAISEAYLDLLQKEFVEVLNAPG